MKAAKIFLFAATTALMWASIAVEASAQSETDAIHHAQQNLNGSARYQGMAGAMGAVGVDFSSIQQNPAGLALYRGFFGFSLSGDVGWGTHNANWYGQNFTEKTSNGSLNEFSVYGALPIGLKSGFSYGFGFHRTADYKRRVSAVTDADNLTSITDYAAALVNNSQYYGDDLISHSSLGSDDAFGNNRLPWLGILGFGGGWIESNDPQGGLYFPRTVYNGQIVSPSDADIWLSENGSTMAYDFAFGFNIENIAYLGMTVNMSSISHYASHGYSEGYLVNEEDRKQDYIQLLGNTSTSAFGAGVGFGAIVEPVAGLRLGLAYYTPTWYTATRRYNAEASSRYGGDLMLFDEDGTPIKHLALTSPERAGNEYSYRSPGRLVASAAYVFGRYAILSADYEYRDLGSSRLGDIYNRGSNSYRYDNEAIKDDFGAEHTFRIGIEAKPTNRLSLRAGYMTRSQPIKSPEVKDFSGAAKREIYVAGTAPHYVLPGSTWAATCGLGYRLTPSMSLDLAFVWQRQNAHLYTFPSINDAGAMLDPNEPSAQPDFRLSQEAVSLKSDNARFTLTLSMRI